VVATGFLGWFANPLFMAVLLPHFFIYYLSVGARHRLGWHVVLFGGLIGGVAANLFWLLDWFRFWWIRVPLRSDMPLLAHRTFRTIWEAPLWGGPTDRAFGCVLLVAGLGGIGLWNWGGQRATARLFGLSVWVLLALATAGIAAEPVGRLGAARLVVPSALFAVVPAAHAIAWALGRLRRPALGLACLVAPCVAGLTWPTTAPLLMERLRGPEPLEIGLNAGRQKIVEVLRAQTTAEARILWEDRREERTASRWTALLPVLTGRSFIGGLDPNAGIEHTATGLVDQYLADRLLRDWTDEQLREYCERYNVGWVVCWTPGATERFRSWLGYDPVAELEDGGKGSLFALKRRPNFALTGSAKWVEADARHIVLEDVRPVDGQVVLSLHYLTGMRATPDRVTLERAQNASDRIPLVRLRVKEPVARLTLVWDRHWEPVDKDKDKADPNSTGKR
jgi:hypothetical protein